MCKEMIQFREFLDDKKIDWVDKSDAFDSEYIDRTHFYYNNNLVSVINGFCSYGGYSFFNKKNEGLLEVRIGNNEPVGYLTADEAINYIFS